MVLNCDRKDDLGPGSEHMIQVSATAVNSDQALKTIDPDKRNCFFDGERKLQLFKVSYLGLSSFHRSIIAGN